MGSYAFQLRNVSIKMVAIYHFVQLLKFHKNGLIVVSFKCNYNALGKNDK